MANMSSNLARDLSRYENYAERNKERNKQRESIKTTAAPLPKANVLTTALMVMAIALVGIMLAACITSKARIADVHAQIIAEKAIVQDLEQENVSMLTRLEQKSSQKVVEDYAENILGMQKLDNAQVEYISLESGNKAEIAEADENVFTSIINSINELVEYLKG